MLTYMSIRDDIKACCEEGRLVEHSPLVSRGVALRTVYVSALRLDGRPSLHDLLSGPGAASERVRWLYARQYLDAFVEEPRITIPPDSMKAKLAFMSRLQPGEQEVWDIRCFDPAPGLRMLGRFAEKDVFIALNWGFREEIDINKGTRKSDKRRYAMCQCERAWQELFGLQRQPFSGSYPYDYITGASISTDSVRRSNTP